MSLIEGFIPRRWVQVDYDISRSQDQARRRFLRKLKSVGARYLTDSVYHMPYSDIVYQAVVEVANIQGNRVHVVRPEFESVVDRQLMAGRYLDDVISALNQAEETVRFCEDRVVKGELSAEKAVRKLRHAISQIDDVDPALQRISEHCGETGQLSTQSREIRAYAEKVLNALARKAQAERAVEKNEST